MARGGNGYLVGLVWLDCKTVFLHFSYGGISGISATDNDPPKLGRVSHTVLLLFLQGLLGCMVLFVVSLVVCLSLDDGRSHAVAISHFVVLFLIVAVSVLLVVVVSGLVVSFSLVAVSAFFRKAWNTRLCAVFLCRCQSLRMG